jgi:hypothetical protein
MWNTIRRILFVMVIAVFAGQLRAAVTLADLLAPGAQIVSGDKVFFDFHNFSEINGIGAANIQVVPIVSGTEYGIRFQAAWSLSGANKVYDLGFDFFVKRLDGKPFIHDNTLTITGGQVNGGTAQVVEGVTDPSNDATLANKFVYITPNGTDLNDHKIFTYNVGLAHIAKDFAMTTGPDETAQVFVSHIDQTFSQVPEPGVLAIMSLASLGLLRRKHRA